MISQNSLEQGKRSPMIEEGDEEAQTIKGTPKGP